MKKTQAFLVMGFIIAAALAIGFFMQKEQERNTRIKIENMFSSMIKDRNSLVAEMTNKIQKKETNLFCNLFNSIMRHFSDIRIYLI